MTLIKFLHKTYLMVSARTKFNKAADCIFGTQTNTMNDVPSTRCSNINLENAGTHRSIKNHDQFITQRM